MVYSRRFRVEERTDKARAIRYVFFSIVLLFLLFKFGLPYTVKLIGFVSDFKNSTVVPENNDTTPPAPPYVKNTPKETNVDSFEIAGTAESGVTVIIEHSGSVTETIANTNGDFLSTITLVGGENIIYISAKDQSGNMSISKTSVKVILDKMPPEIAINSPSDGSSFFGDKNKVVQIVGQTEPEATLTVSGHKAIVKSDGTFQSAVTLNNGSNEILIVSKDRAGNTKEQTLNLNFSN